MKVLTGFMGVSTELYVFPGTFHSFDVCFPGTKISIRFNDEIVSALKGALTKQQQIRGAVVLVARNGKVAYQKAFGEMDDGKPMRNNTIFRICSMTKPITAVAVMMLWEQGLFTLDDPIANYIPEFKDMKVLVMDKTAEKGFRLEPAKTPITIRQLLSHTSGLTYGFFAWPVIGQCYVDNDVSDGFRTTSGTIGDGVKRLAKCPLVFQPGESFEYGLNFDVLGRLVEVVSGMPFDKFLQKNVFDPLKMKDTSFFVPAEKVGRLAALYESSPKGGLNKVDKRVTRGFMTETPSLIYDSLYGYEGPKTYFSGGAGLHSTAADYMRFAQMLANGGTLESARLLSPSTINLMVQNEIGDFVIGFAGKGIKYGLGLGIYADPVANGTLLSKGSYQWMGIYNTQFFVDPGHNLAAIYLTQLFPNLTAPDLMKKLEVLTEQAVVK
ncbi:MAG: Esterase EstB [Syntrophorhabdaceae bacterium PtaU1.Bin034]|nr:MAG: Esterase EstB [Syntrophorhabdaceae bacterium PtaU1.Bin034]